MLFPIKAYIHMNINTFGEKSLRGKIEIFWENNDLQFCRIGTLILSSDKKSFRSARSVASPWVAVWKQTVVLGLTCLKRGVSY